LTLPLPAGRSAILYHQAKKALFAEYGDSAYFMPNALKLPEMITETVAEVHRTELPSAHIPVLISASSGTIAAGVLKGLREVGWTGEFIVHLGYSRPRGAVIAYMAKMADWLECVVEDSVTLIDEGYAYSDEARPGETPSFQCNIFYDLKCFRWWLKEGRARYGKALMWNIG